MSKPNVAKIPRIPGQKGGRGPEAKKGRHNGTHHVSGVKKNLTGKRVGPCTGRGPKKAKKGHPFPRDWKKKDAYEFAGDYGGEVENTT